MRAMISTPAVDQPAMESYQAPVPLARMVRVQLRAWRAQRALVWLTGFALLLGLATTVFAFNAITDAHPTAAAVQDKFVGASGGYALLWLAIGVLAGATPFRGGWAELILSVAPRRLRWLSASYLATIGVALATTAVFGVLAWAAATIMLAGRNIEGPLGVLTTLPHVAVQVVLTVTIGFALGAAARSVTAPLMLGYLAAMVLPTVDSGSAGISTTWFDHETATAVAAGQADAPHGIAPVVVALGLWILVPAVTAVIRLRHRDLR